MKRIISQERAHRAVRTALENGVLVRPSTCEKCGNSDKKSESGRHTIQAHHPDHSKTLEVEWLCPGCHRQVTPYREIPPEPVFGDRNGQTKIPDKEISYIKTCGLSGPILAEKYGVDRSTINKIKRGEIRSISTAPEPTVRKEEQCPKER